MSTSYSSDVFFGACVKAQSKLGKKLDAYVEAAGGTPAETETPGVEIIMVGSQCTGDVWMVARAIGSGASFDRETEIEAPKMLAEDPAWRANVGAFFARLGVKNPPPIGWHFAGSAS